MTAQISERLDGNGLSLAEFALALAELHGQSSLEALCRAAAQLGSSALGLTWVALLARPDDDAPLRPIVTATPGLSNWPVAAPRVPAEHLPVLLERLAGRTLVAPALAEIMEDAVARDLLAAIGSTIRPALTCVSPVLVEEQTRGVVVVLLQSAEAPDVALAGLAVHTARAMSGLLLIEQSRAAGECDPATQLLGRRAFEDQVRREIARAARYRRTFALLSLRIEAADAEMLRRLGRGIQGLIREVDTLARFDEGRLVVLMPECGRREAFLLAHRLDEWSSDLQFGVAVYPHEGDTWEGLAAAVVQPVVATEPAVAPTSAPAGGAHTPASWPDPAERRRSLLDAFPAFDRPPAPNGQPGRGAGYA